MTHHPPLRLTYVEGATPQKWIRRWEESRPRLHHRLVTQPEQLDGVLEGSADLALVRLPVPEEGLHVVRLYDEQPVAVVGADHPAAAYDELTSSDLADDLIDADALAPADRVAAVVREGAVVLPMAVARLHARRDVVAVPLTDLDPTTIALIWRRERDDDDIQDFVGITKGRGPRSSR